MLEFGSYHVIVPSDVLEAMDLVVVVQALIIKCIEKEVLCNEFYLQLIKQTTGTEFGAKLRNGQFDSSESSIRFRILFRAQSEGGDGILAPDDDGNLRHVPATSARLQVPHGAPATSRARR